MKYPDWSRPLFPPKELILDNIYIIIAIICEREYSIRFLFCPNLFFCEKQKIFFTVRVNVTKCKENLRNTKNFDLK